MSPDSVTTVSPVALVVGGDPAERAREIGELLLARSGTALVLTSAPELLDVRLDSSEAGPVEVRSLSSSSLVAAFLAGGGAPVDPVLAALGTGADAPLASCLGWEYVRRAAAAGAWDTIVVDADGDLAAVRRAASAAELSAFIECHWPAHRRFASLAAGSRIDPQILNVHRLAELASEVGHFLSGTIDVRGVGSRAGTFAALVDLARGAARTSIHGDVTTGFWWSVQAPVAPVDTPWVEGEYLRFSLPGLEVSIVLPAVLQRCDLVSVDCIGFGHSDRQSTSADSAAGMVRAWFRPDPLQWPPTLIPVPGDGSISTG